MLAVVEAVHNALAVFLQAVAQVLDAPATWMWVAHLGGLCWPRPAPWWRRRW